MSSAALNQQARVGADFDTKSAADIAGVRLQGAQATQSERDALRNAALGFSGLGVNLRGQGVSERGNMLSAAGTASGLELGGRELAATDRANILGASADFANLGVGAYQAAGNQFTYATDALGVQSQLADAVQSRALERVASTNEAEQLRLASITAGIETMSLPYQLKIAQTAAENAGSITNNRSGGGLFGK